MQIQLKITREASKTDFVSVITEIKGYKFLGVHREVYTVTPVSLALSLYEYTAHWGKLTLT